MNTVKCEACGGDVVDGKQVSLALTDDDKTHDSQDLVFWTKSPHAAEKVINPIFEHIWKELD